MMVRIRRTRPAAVTASTPSRVRRTRTPDATQQFGRVRRSRGMERPSDDPRDFFVIDWNRPLGWKLQIYLVSSCLYYQTDRSIITDGEFDRLCKELADGWDTFEHPHKQYTSKEDMVAGTGYANKYPLMVRCAADTMMRTFRER
jgi:hypothetical protein